MSFHVTLDHLKKAQRIPNYSFLMDRMIGFENWQSAMKNLGIFKSSLKRLLIWKLRIQHVGGKAHTFAFYSAFGFRTSEKKTNGKGRKLNKRPKKLFCRMLKFSMKSIAKCASWYYHFHRFSFQKFQIYPSISIDSSQRQNNVAGCLSVAALEW